MQHGPGYHTLIVTLFEAMLSVKHFFSKAHEEISLLKVSRMGMKVTESVFGCGTPPLCSL